MFVPPENENERKAHDINMLRVFYIVCETLEIAEDEDIQKSFFHLVKWAGKSNFIEEFLLFEEFVQSYEKKEK